MLTIRRQQFEALEQASRRNFRDRATAHIAAEYPEYFSEAGEEGTRRLVLAGIEKAAAHGITTEGAVLVFIELMVEVGTDFGRSPDRNWVYKILAHPTLPGNCKVDAVQKRIRSRTQGRSIVVHRKGAN
jgi:hypothetical protein